MSLKNKYRLFRFYDLPRPSASLRYLFLLTLHRTHNILDIIDRDP
jgi:hypothetical protein